MLATLRAETAEAHVGLEKSMDVFEQVRTKEDYRALLESFFTLYEPMEMQLGAMADWTALGWDFRPRDKTSWLHDDLRVLGTSEDNLARMPRWPGKMTGELGEAIGALYVIEGSTLGGQMISKRFRETLGITPEQGGKFFQGYGEATGRHWRAFGQWAEAQDTAANGELQNSAITGARNTFDIFAQWLMR